MSRKNNWCWTINANAEEALKWDTATGELLSPPPLAIELGNAKYVQYQVERAPTTGQVHLQGFVTFRAPISMQKVKDYLGNNTAHIEPMMGTVQDSIVYCSKSATKISGPYSLGTAPQGQGHRSDLEGPAAAIKAGASKRKVAEDFPVQVIKFARGMDALRHTLDHCPRWRDLHVTWVWGPTGSGKTRLCMDSVAEPTDIHIVHSDGLWWDGYDGQDSILFDDFYGQIKCAQMLRYLDGHPLQLPVKGGFVYAKYTKVWITSNVHYSDLWKRDGGAIGQFAGPQSKIPDEVRAAFERRIHEVINKTL